MGSRRRLSAVVVRHGCYRAGHRNRFDLRVPPRAGNWGIGRLPRVFEDHCRVFSGRTARYREWNDRRGLKDGAGPGRDARRHLGEPPWVARHVPGDRPREPVVAGAVGPGRTPAALARSRGVGAALPKLHGTAWQARRMGHYSWLGWRQLHVVFLPELATLLFRTRASLHA